MIQAGTFEITFDRFPGLCSIRLPYRNVDASVVPTVAYTDTSGDPQTFTDFSYSPSRVWPILDPNNQAWPETQFGFIDQVTITFDAGYASQQDVPADLKDMVLTQVGSLFNGCGDEAYGAAHQALAKTQVTTYL